MRPLSETTTPAAGPIEALLTDHRRLSAADMCSCGTRVSSNIEHLRHLVEMSYELGHVVGWFDVLKHHDNYRELPTRYQEPPK